MEINDDVPDIVVHGNEKGVEIETKISKKKTKSFLIPCVFFLFVCSFFWWEIFYRTPSFSGTKEIEISKGMGVLDIATLLKEKEIIHSRWFFVGYAFVKRDSGRMQSGAYSFPPLPLSHVEKNIVLGGAKVIIVIPEGWTSQDIESYLKEKKISSPEKFHTLSSQEGIAHFGGEFSFLREIPRDAGLEGFLFPDTYVSRETASAEGVIHSFLKNFDEKLTPELRASIAQQGKTMYQIITMASLIEKEVVSDDDRAVVSGILWKRISFGIPLQVDATIHFVKEQNGMVSGTDGKISLIDTKIDSLYNTYKYIGLPKGPIGNPGISAIKAAIHPRVSPYVYYLSAPSGKTIFSVTLDEHNAAKAKYLK